MATVKFSRELRSNIVNSAYNRFNDKVTVAKNSRPDHHWGEFVYDKFFAEYKDALDAVPKAFLHSHDEIRVQIVNNVRSELQFKLSDIRPLPSSWTSPLGRSYSHNYFELFMSDEWMPLHNEVVAWKERIKQAETQRDEFVKNIRQVVEAYSTLAPALRAWPPLWDYISEDIKERHRAIEKREKKTVDIGVDLNKLTAMATAQKMGV